MTTSEQLKTKAFADSLGYNAQSSTPPSEIDLRFERYRLQYVARGMFLNEGSKQVEAGVLSHKYNVHKTCKCLFTRYSNGVQVLQSNEHKTCFYGGLVVCGNVWTCPVCAAKIQERRRVEVAQAFDYAYKSISGKKVILVTFTFPHYRWQKLNDLLYMQADAYRRLRAGEPWKRIKDRCGYEGLIRSLELTIGDNGWHPHTHEAWIVDESTDTEVLRSVLTERWLNMCNRAGITVNNEDAFRLHAVDIIDNAHCSEYLAKQDSSRHWGMDRELVKGSSKIGKINSKSGVHPFSLLNENRESEFMEYARAMRGRPQLFWSKGLKDKVGINDISDEELATEIEDTADLLAQLKNEDWSIIVKSGVSARTDILKAAETRGLQGINEVLEKLTSGMKEIPSPDNASSASLGHPIMTESEIRKKQLSENILQRGSEVYQSVHVVSPVKQPSISACLSLAQAVELMKPYPQEPFVQPEH